MWSYYADTKIHYSSDSFFKSYELSPAFICTNNIGSLITSFFEIEILTLFLFPLKKILVCIIVSVIYLSISNSKYNRLARSSYITSPKELDNPRNGLIDIYNTDDNECFKWCLVRYLNTADHNARIIKKANKNFAKRLDFTLNSFQSKLETLTK